MGTSDFISRLLNHFVEKFKASNPNLKTDVRKNPRAMAKLSTEAQRIFKVLSANPEIVSTVSPSGSFTACFVELVSVLVFFFENN
ncbi:unnamed protein product [Dibothriocephalus latus]|uniref:Uncharacterized protein n=1 Tax=Dibothriocephalus latus TaxID=60516 RepID=A0A3P6QX68_DIBLA|nr:unnamed protein product [Dibothriocephalus latus]